MFRMTPNYSFFVFVALLGVAFSASPLPEEKTFAKLNVLEHPDNNSLTLDLHAFDRNHSVHLIPAPQIFAPELHEYVSHVDQDGRPRFIRTINAARSHEAMQKRMYTDDTGLTSVHIDRKNGHDYVEGIVNGQIKLVPMVQLLTSKTSKPIHIAYRTNDTDGLDRKCRVFDVDKSNLTVEHMDNVTVDDGVTAEDRIGTLPANIYPEVLVVVDYVIASYFNFNNDAIKRYLGIFFNSVVRRYNNIVYPKIQMVITGLIMITNAQAQPFMSSAISSTDKIHDERTLDNFGRWLRSWNGYITAKYDVAYLMTGLDVTSWTTGGWDPSTNGVAYVGTACLYDSRKNYNVGVGEDKAGSFRGIHTATHELAHLLGAPHDGDASDSPPGNPGATQCNWSDGYIMSYEFGTRNKFYFSQCSVLDIQYSLGSSQMRCVLDSPAARDVQMVPTLPGQLLTLDQQCQTVNGPNAFFYEKATNDLCAKMWCRKPGQSVNWFPLVSFGPAFEGSICDAGKWCINGECVVQPS